MGFFTLTLLIVVGIGTVFLLLNEGEKAKEAKKIIVEIFEKTKELFSLIISLSKLTVEIIKENIEKYSKEKESSKNSIDSINQNDKENIKVKTPKSTIKITDNENKDLENNVNKVLTEKDSSTENLSVKSSTDAVNLKSINVNTDLKKNQESASEVLENSEEYRDQETFTKNKVDLGISQENYSEQNSKHIENNDLIIEAENQIDKNETINRPVEEELMDNDIYLKNNTED